MLALMVMSNELAEITAKQSRIRASKARYAFAHNSIDMTAFFAVHQHVVKTLDNKLKRHAYILNKATYVLVASLWEAYCEDIVEESVDLLVDHVPSWDKLPQPLTRD